MLFLGSAALGPERDGRPRCRARGGPAGASGPRVRLRTEAGASLWCSGAAPAPPAARPAAGRTGCERPSSGCTSGIFFFRETEGALVRGGTEEQGPPPPRARRAPTTGQPPPRAPPRGRTPGPTTRPVGFLIAQDWEGRWGSPRPPPLTPRGGSQQHLAGPSIHAAKTLPPGPGALGGAGQRRHCRDRGGNLTEELGELGGPGAAPHRGAQPWRLLPRAGALGLPFGDSQAPAWPPGGRPKLGALPNQGAAGAGVLGPAGV